MLATSFSHNRTWDFLGLKKEEIHKTDLYMMAGISIYTKPNLWVLACLMSVLF